MSKTIYSKFNLCPAKAGTLCGCGRCKNIIFTLATKAGIHPAAFVDSLGLKVAKTQSNLKPSKNVRHSRVAESFTLTMRGGEQITGPRAIVKTLSLLNEV